VFIIVSSYQSSETCTSAPIEGGHDSLPEPTSAMSKNLVNL